MPYLITTKRPCPACQYGPNAGGEHRPDSVSCVAVATLEEARTTAWRAVPDCGCQVACDYEKACAAALILPEAGGTVGPLPDGSLIEVEPLSWADLRERAGLDRDGFTLDTQTLAAFNEANR